MAMEVDLALNARRFQAGTKDAEKALAGLQDVVEDFTRDASNAGEKGADAFDETKDAARDAEREFDRAARSIDDVRDELKRAEDAADDLGRKGKDAGDDIRDGMRDAGEGTQTFKDEARQNAEEVASSFDGSVESIADGFQGLASTAFSGFGPAGAVAGLAVAAGIGLGVAGFEAMNEAEEESRERAATWAQTWIDNGARVLSATALTSNMDEIIGDQERWAEVETIAAAAGVEQSLALRALAGDTVAYQQVMEQLTEAEEANNAAIAGTGDELTARALGYYDLRSEIGESINALEDENQAMQDGQIIADAYTQSVLDTAIAHGEATRSVNALGDEVYALPDGTTITVDAQTGVATMRVQSVEDQINNLPDGNSTINVATGPVNSSSVANYIASNPSVVVRVNAVTPQGYKIPF